MGPEKNKPAGVHRRVNSFTVKGSASRYSGLCTGADYLTGLDRLTGLDSGLTRKLDFATVDYRHKDAVQIISFTAFSFANPFSDQ